MSSHIQQLLHQSLAYMLTQQQNNGSFLTYSSADPQSFAQALTFNSIFSTSLIVCSLQSLPTDPIKEKILSNATNFLISQKGPYWSFNYWLRNSSESEKMPYPDDLDDSSCSLAALYLTRPELFDGTALAQIVTMLTVAERNPGGPYYTWIAPEEAPEIWRDVDIAVNANVAYFLSLLQIDLPNLTDFIEDHIQAQVFASPYYPSKMPILYFISRSYQGKQTRKLIKTIEVLRTKKGVWSNPLETALAIISLLKLGVPKKQLVQAIRSLETTHKQGCWEAYPFYTGVNPHKDRTYYAGSQALTTAYCLEAINLYYQPSLTEEDPTSIIHLKVIADVKDHFSRLSPQLQTDCHQMIDKILAQDTSRQISLLPWYFHQSLKKSTVSEQQLIKLGAANIFGWLAYTIYDDFMDQEGQPKLLPIANISLRQLSQIFTELMSGIPTFQPIFNQLMDQIDQANYLEITTFREHTKSLIPSYSNLADKSLGHALGCLATLYLNGYTYKSKGYQQTLLFFKHYLIAKQIHDDSHDWEEDLARGQHTPVTIQLLRKVPTKKITESSLKKMREYFWSVLLKSLCKDIQNHLNQANQALERNRLFADKSFFYRLTNSLEDSAQKALTEQQRAIEFVKQYQNPV